MLARSKPPKVKGEERHGPGDALNTLEVTEGSTKCLQGDTRVQGMDGLQIAT